MRRWPVAVTGSVCGMRDGGEDGKTTRELYMIEMHIHTTYQAACDHCGTRPRHDIHGQDVPQAIRLAVDQGFVHTTWRDNDCHRESLLCPACEAKSKAEYAAAILRTETGNA